MKNPLPFAFLCFSLLAPLASARPRQVVMMIGEDEYHTWETLPAFAEKDLRPAGYEVTVIQQDPANKNHFPGIARALKKADVLVLSVRRRTPPRDELDAVRAYLDAGHPLVGIRTACHAFAMLPKDHLSDPGLEAWQKFDPEVLGGHYTTHSHRPINPTMHVAPGAGSHPILAGIDVNKMIGYGQLYYVSPLQPGTVPLIIGVLPGEPEQPVAWTHVYGPNRAQIFYTSLGSPGDFGTPSFRRLLSNAVAWATAPSRDPAAGP